MRKRISSFFSNNWVVTLTATLIGVFSALYLNEYVATKKLNVQKDIATQNIISEFDSNQKSLDSTIKEHERMLDIFNFLMSTLNDENEMIVHKDTVNIFRMKHPDVFTIKDSTYIQEDIFQYHGEINTNMSMPQLNMSSVALNTFNNSGFGLSYDFECLLYLEKIAIVTRKINQMNNNLLEDMVGMLSAIRFNESILSEMELLVDFEKMLLGLYEAKDESLKKCY